MNCRLWRVRGYSEYFEYRLLEHCSRHAVDTAIDYNFHGNKSAIPTRFERIQIPRLFYNRSETYTETESLLLLDVKSEYRSFFLITPSCYVDTGESTLERLKFTVDSVSVLFHSSEELDYFVCNASTPLNTRVPIASLDCSSSVFNVIRPLDVENTLSVRFGSVCSSASRVGASSVTIDDWAGKLDFVVSNRNSWCL